MCDIRLCVNDMRKKIKQMLEEKGQDKCASIYKVPLVLAEQKEDPYIPKWVSLGPYHHKAAHLSADMETQKVRAVHRMMSRINPDKPNMSTFDQIVTKLKKTEIKIRESYETAIEYNGEYLACMMAFDGCFVLEILRCLSEETENEDPFFNRHKIEYASYSLLTDILLLENQVPLFVLTRLLKLETKSNIEARKKLSEMLIKDREVGRLFYPFIFEKEEWRRQVHDLIASEEPAHLLDLAIRLARGDPSTWPEQNTQLEDATLKGKVEYLGFTNLCKYLCFIILCKRRSKVKDTVYSFTIPTATELKEAGIRFEPSEGGLRTIDFSYEKSTLLLPRINVTASAGIFLRNLMAYEICQTPDKRIISNFAVLMDELINTDRDVALLRRKGIIHTYSLGSDKYVASFFNDLRKGAVGAGSNSIDTFRDQRKKLLRCYRRKYRVIFVEFVRVHCSKPWRAASAVAAIVLLILTLLQTIYTIKGTIYTMKGK